MRNYHLGHILVAGVLAGGKYLPELRVDRSGERPKHGCGYGDVICFERVEGASLIKNSIVGLLLLGGVEAKLFGIDVDEMLCILCR